MVLACTPKPQSSVVPSPDRLSQYILQSNIMIAKGWIISAMHYPKNLWCQRAFSFCYCAYPFVCRSCVMETNAPCDFCKQQHNPKERNSSGLFALLMRNGGFISWLNKNLTSRRQLKSASSTLGFKTHLPYRLLQTGCNVKALLNLIIRVTSWVTTCSVNTVHLRNVVKEFVKAKTTEQVHTQSELSERMYQHYPGCKDIHTINWNSITKHKQKETQFLSRKY